MDSIPVACYHKLTYLVVIQHKTWWHGQHTVHSHYCTKVAITSLLNNALSSLHTIFSPSCAVAPLIRHKEERVPRLRSRCIPFKDSTAFDLYSICILQSTCSQQQRSCVHSWITVCVLQGICMQQWWARAQWQAAFHINLCVVDNVWGAAPEVGSFLMGNTIPACLGAVCNIPSCNVFELQCTDVMSLR